MAAIWSGCLAAHRIPQRPGKPDGAAVPAGGHPDATPGEARPAQVPTVRTHRNRRDSPRGRSARRARWPDPRATQRIGGGTTGAAQRLIANNRRVPSPVCAVIRAWLSRSGQRAPGLGPGEQPAVADLPRVDPDAGALGREHAPGAVRLTPISSRSAPVRPQDRRRPRARMASASVCASITRAAVRSPTASAVSDRQRCQVARPRVAAATDQPRRPAESPGPPGRRPPSRPMSAPVRRAGRSVSRGPRPR